MARAVLAPFVTIGFPDLEASTDIVVALTEAGADIVELGIPFTDPLADGLTIQKTSFEALKQGVNVHTALDVVRLLRVRGVKQPLILMGYYNPFLRYGVEKFVRDSQVAGVDGFIVPDLPTEESGTFRTLCRASGIYLIPLVAPTSTDERIAQACKLADGFIYCVSVTGVTGARSGLRQGLSALVGRIRRHTDLPIIVGFGVSTRAHIDEISQIADGAVVASALLDVVGSVPKHMAAQTAGDFLKGLRGH